MKEEYLNQDAHFLITAPRHDKKTELRGTNKERIFITFSAREKLLTDKLNLFCWCQGAGKHL
jgi:hypothetical protein